MTGTGHRFHRAGATRLYSMVIGSDGETTSKAAVFDAFAGVVKAFGNGRRLELIELLAQGEHSVEVLARMAGMAVTTTSAHLQSLRQAGLVKTRKERTTVYYRLAGDDIAELFIAAKRVGLRRSPELRDTVSAYLEQPCPAPSTIDPAGVTADMTVVDVRPEQEYQAGHFPGAVSIPLAQLPARYTELPTTPKIVLYCRGEFCRLAREAACFLHDRGYDAHAMDEGVMEWRVNKDVTLNAA